MNALARLSLLLFILFLSPVTAQTSRLDTIQSRGVLVVATPGDYPPFAVLQNDGSYRGLDVELCRRMAEALGVKLRFVRVDWASLTTGFDRYDLVVGGVTRTLKRQTRAGFTRPYVTVGKCPLVRAADASRYTSLQAIDRPEVRVAVNPGGTNEAFVRKHLTRARIEVYQENLRIPEAVAQGQADVMITDNVEARLAARRDPRLVAVEPPFTQETIGMMAPRDDQAFLNWLNLFLETLELRGDLKTLKQKWL